MNPATGLRRIISGGQQGADLAGLRAARHLGLETGGTAPHGKLSEALDAFGLEQHPDDKVPVAVSYVLRTRQNVDDSDATVAFRVRASPGTDKTIQYCVSGKWQTPTFTVDATKDAKIIVGHHRPVLIVQHMTPAAQEALRAFLRELNVRVLNVAGHRNALGELGWEDEVELFLIKALSPE